MSTLSADRQARLVRKGQILYGKVCKANGRGTCAESFARHQIDLGNLGVAREFVDWLERRLADLRQDDPEGLLESTETLIERIETRLDERSEPR